MTARKLLLTVGCAAILGILAVGSTTAWGNPRRTNYLTFSRSVGLPGVTLAPGSYIFELPDSLMNRDIVQVLSRDRSRVHYMGFTRPVERPRDQRSTGVVTLGEASAREAQPIKAWFPLGEPLGHEFIYTTR